MKKLLKYPFLCLLVLSMVAGAPFIWQQIGLLPKFYPNVFKACSFDRLPDRALLFKWAGKTAGDPTILMAHPTPSPAPLLSAVPDNTHKSPSSSPWASSWRQVILFQGGDA